MVDFNGASSPNLCDRMQNLQLNVGGKPKLFHYCYVCNTQLNSCKQALLHCSGKRHRKKLQFLQSRKTASGQLSTPLMGGPPGGQTAGAMLPPLLEQHHQNGPGFIYPLVNAYHPISAAAAESQPPALISSDSANVLRPPTFYPHALHHHRHHQQQQHILHDLQQQQQQQQLHAWPTPPTAYHQMLQPLPPAAVAALSHVIQSPPPLAPHPAIYAAAADSMTFAVSSDGSLRSLSNCSYSNATTRSAIISPSETSSISSESFSAGHRLHTCHVCQRQFVNNIQLHAHLQTARHYKTPPLPYASSPVRKVFDSSETDSFVSSSSVYYCTMCNVGQAVNSHHQIIREQNGSCNAAGGIAAGGNSSSRIKSRSTGVGGHRQHSRSSSTSSEPIEIVADSGYVSGSGDELICISHPTPDKPTAKFRCQLCNTFLNSPAQAKQHLSSQKHLLRVSSTKKPVFRRRSSNSIRKKLQMTGSGATGAAHLPVDQCTNELHVDTAHCSTTTTDRRSSSQLDDFCDSSSLQSPDPDTDATVIIVRGAHSL